MKTRSQGVVTTGLFIALGLIIPYVTGHAFGLQGTVFLPMHIPVLLCGILSGPYYGLIAGILTPVLSSLLTGMPPAFPMLPIMLFELGIYGLVSGYLYNKRKLPIYPTLIISMICGRIAYGIVFQILMLANNNSLKAASVPAAFMTGLPGIAVQLILIPILVGILKRSTLANSNNQQTSETLAQAKQIIKSKKASCVVYNEDKILFSADGRGVSPLINLYESQPELLKGNSVADKIIGKAAVDILILGGVDFIYGELMSKSAKECLDKRKIKYSYGRCVDLIMNRDESGICPIEKSVLGIEDSDEAYKVIKSTIANLQKSAS